MRSKLQDGRLVLAIDDVIGGGWLGGINARDVRAALDAAPDAPVTVRLDSPGGDSREGIGICNALRRHRGHVRGEVESMAYSSASVIAMAGAERLIAPNAMLMIHRAWTLTVGDADEHARAQGMLARDDETYASTYADGSGQVIPDVLAQMAAETYLTAAEAVAQGLMTGLLDVSGATPDAVPARPEDAADAAVSRFPAAAAWCRRAAAHGKRDVFHATQGHAAHSIVETANSSAKTTLASGGGYRQESARRASSEKPMPIEEPKPAAPVEPETMPDEETDTMAAAPSADMVSMLEACSATCSDTSAACHHAALGEMSLADCAAGCRACVEACEAWAEACEAEAGGAPLSSATRAAKACGTATAPGSTQSAEVTALRAQLADAEVDATERVLGAPLDAEVRASALALYGAGQDEAARTLLRREEFHAGRTQAIAKARVLAPPAQ